MSAKVDLKVVILGKEFVGKSSLLDRFVNNRFVSNSDRKSYQATIGSAFASKVVAIDSREVSLGVWDTAGSERFESMSRQYYRNARSAIICIDATDISSTDRARFWAQEVLHNEELCRLYVCVTKTDITVADPGLRRVSAQEVNALSHALNARLFETSAKTGTGVQELFRTIAKDFLEFEMGFSEDMPTIGLTKANSKKSFCCF